jgi:hypothetical protein
MSSDNVRKAREIMARYPEVSQSLGDYERTKSIPKLYRRKRLNITIDENVLRDFKRYCAHKDINMSRLIERCILERMKN